MSRLSTLLVGVVGVAALASAGDQSSPRPSAASPSNVNVVNSPTVNLTSGTSVGISGTPTVNVGGTPSVTISGTPSVSVSGTASVTVANASPISTSNKETRTPVSLAFNIPFLDNANMGWDASYSVPQGMRLFVKHVTARVALEPGDRVNEVTLSSEPAPNSQLLFLEALPMVSMGSDQYNDACFSGSDSVDFVLNSGTYLYISMTRAVSGYFTTYDIAVSGYLEPMP